MSRGHMSRGHIIIQRNIWLCWYQNYLPFTLPTFIPLSTIHLGLCTARSARAAATNALKLTAYAWATSSFNPSHSPCVEWNRHPCSMLHPASMPRHHPARSLHATTHPLHHLSQMLPDDDEIKPSALHLHQIMGQSCSKPHPYLNPKTLCTCTQIMPRSLDLGEAFIAAMTCRIMKVYNLPDPSGFHSVCRIEPPRCGGKQQGAQA